MQRRNISSMRRAKTSLYNRPVIISEKSKLTNASVIYPPTAAPNKGAVIAEQPNKMCAVDA
jgi:hypothetical protein